jgi:hypothetical protein
MQMPPDRLDPPEQEYRYRFKIGIDACDLCDLCQRIHAEEIVLGLILYKLGYGFTDVSSTSISLQNFQTCPLLAGISP